MVAISPRTKIRLKTYFKTDNAVAVKRSGEYINNILNILRKSSYFRITSVS